MYGLFPAMMEAERFRAQRDDAAADRAMRQQEFGMRKQAFDAQMQDQARQRRLQDELAASVGEAGPAAPGLSMPEITRDQGAMFAANGVLDPEPKQAQGLAAPGGVSKQDAAAQRLAASKGDLQSFYGVKDRVKKDTQDFGRRAEMTRLSALPEREIAAMWQQFNSDPNTPGTVAWDPKAKKFLIASNDEKTLPSGSHSKAEMVSEMMALWEAGNGDTLKGMDMMRNNAKARREGADKRFEQTRQIATGNADAQFKGADDDRQGRQVDAQIAHWGAIERQNAANGGQPLSDASKQKIEALMAQIGPTTTPQQRAIIHDQVNGIILMESTLGRGKASFLPNGAQPKADTLPIDKWLEMAGNSPVPGALNPTGDKKFTISKLPFPQQQQMYEQYKASIGSAGVQGGGLPTNITPEPRRGGASRGQQQPGLQPGPQGGAQVGQGAINPAYLDAIQGDASLDRQPVRVQMGGRDLWMDPDGRVREAAAQQPGLAPPRQSASAGGQTDAVDGARAELEAAKVALQQYGLRQRNQDPQGFQAAAQRVQQARERFNQTYDSTVQRPTGAAFRYAQP